MNRPGASPAPYPTGNQLLAPLVFVLDDDPGFRDAISRELGAAPAPFEERRFEDGEHKLRPLHAVGGRDVYVIDRLINDATRSVNDRLIRLLFFVSTLRDHGALRTSCVLPYLPYARKDRRTKPFDPLSLRYLAQLLESAGADRVAVVDVHNPAAFENAFRCRTLHLEARELFARHIADLANGQPVVVISPDTGGIKRANSLRESIEAITGESATQAFLEKYRNEGTLSGSAVVGSLSNRMAVIVDDLIASGSTMQRAVEACRSGGATRVLAVATHGLFVAGSEQLLLDDGPDRLLVTNSVPQRLAVESNRRLTVVSVEPLIAEGIRELAHG